MIQRKRNNNHGFFRIQFIAFVSKLNSYSMLFGDSVNPYFKGTVESGFVS